MYPEKTGPLSSGMTLHPDISAVHVMKCVAARCINVATLSTNTTGQAYCAAFLAMYKLLTVATAQWILDIQGLSRK